MDLRTLGIAAFLALATFGGADAQTGQVDTTTEIVLTPLDHALDRDETVVLPVRVVHTYSLGVTTRPTQIDLVIVEAPPWIVAAVSPASVYVNPTDTRDLAGAVGIGKQAQAESRLTLALVKDAPASALAAIRVAAVAHDNGDLRGSKGVDEILVRTAAFAEVPACDAAVGATSAADAASEEDADEVQTQSASFAPVATPVVGALGLAGAAAGGFYAIRRKDG